MQQEAKKCKILDYRDVKSELSVRWPFFVNFCRYTEYFKKTNLISFSYLLRGSNWPSISKIDYLTVATISLIFCSNYSYYSKTARRVFLYYQIVIPKDKTQLLAKFKKNLLVGFRATLNFQNVTKKCLWASSIICKRFRFGLCLGVKNLWNSPVT